MTSDGSAAPSDGEAENFSFTVRGIKIGDEPMRDLTGPGSVTAVVGANNVGKTTVLRQIHSILSSPFLTQQQSPRIVTEIADPWTGSAEDMWAWLLAYGRHTETTDGSVQVRMGDSAARFEDVVQLRGQSTANGNPSLLLRMQTAHERINVTAPTSRPDPLTPHVTAPFHVLMLDPNARERVHDLAQTLFGVNLYLDSASAHINYRVGELGVATPLVNELNTEYADALGKLRGLQEQGDGIKFALGLLIPLITSPVAVTLIDEPEAFLHPPQARIMGDEIGKLASEKNAQIIVSTHDKDILVGLINSGVPLDVLHLTRVGDTTSSNLLHANEIADLWNDPILRYGNALDGLFHSAVIITEADRDSRFYEAAIDAERDRDPESPAHNLMFIGANGKQNLAKIVLRLRKLGVRVVSCPDLDILDNSTVLRNLIGAHGGQWEDVKSDYDSATNEFAAAPPPPTIEVVRANIEKAFTERGSETTLTEPLADALKTAVSIPASRWKLLKDYGTDAFNANKEAGIRLVKALDDLGIVVAKVGVLEKFLKTRDVSKGSPEWLTIAFEEGAHTKPEAAEHAKRLLKAAGV